MDVTYLLAILFLGAIATYFSGDRLAPKVALLSALGSFIITAFLYCPACNGIDIGVSRLWLDDPKIHLSLGADGLSMAMLLLTTALTPIIIYSSFKNEFRNQKSIYALIMFMSFAMCGTFMATDGLIYYIFWELALVPIYFTAMMWGHGDPDARKKAVVKFFIYTFAGSLFMLAAFAYLYMKAGSFLVGDLTSIALTDREQFWIFFAFFAAYAVKIPLIPFHTWQAAVYQKAPTVGTMLLSGIMLKMGLYSIIRWQLPIAPDAARDFMPFVIWLSIAGVIYGSIVALRQKDLKRLLAYSSLAHVGLIAAGCYTLTVDGMVGAVLQMIAHGFVIVGLFLIAEIIFRRYNTGKIAEMGGIRSQSPKFTSMFLLLVLSSVALPGTFNFVGEFMVLFSLSQVGIGYAILGGSTIILGAVYMLRMFQKVMLGDTNSRLFSEVTFNEGLSLAVIIAILLFFGLYPKPIIDLITPSIEQIFNNINRIN